MLLLYLESTLFVVESAICLHFLSCLQSSYKVQTTTGNYSHNNLQFLCNLLVLAIKILIIFFNVNSFYYHVMWLIRHIFEFIFTCFTLIDAGNISSISITRYCSIHNIRLCLIQIQNQYPI